MGVAAPEFGGLSTTDSRLLLGPWGPWWRLGAAWTLDADDDDNDGGEGKCPRRQCCTEIYASPQTSISGYLPFRLAKRSRVKTTEPLEEFSKGTTPRKAVPIWTAEKTSSIVICGFRVYSSSENMSRAAWETGQKGEMA